MGGKVLGVSDSESPKYLIGKGRDEEALEVIRFIAAQNGKSTSLTLEQLRAAGEGVTMAVSTLDANEKKLAREDDVEAKAGGVPATTASEGEEKKMELLAVVQSPISDQTLRPSRQKTTPHTLQPQ